MSGFLYPFCSKFLHLLISNELDNEDIKAIFHQGACSNTMEWNVDYLYKNNLLYSKELLRLSSKLRCQFIYASSASVYGSGQRFEEKIENENPINLYAYSKFKFDQIVRKELTKDTNQIVGLRYFNVYGEKQNIDGAYALVIGIFLNRCNYRMKLYQDGKLLPHRERK